MRDFAPRPEAGSRNLGHTFLAISVYGTKNIIVEVTLRVVGFSFLGGFHIWRTEEHLWIFLPPLPSFRKTYVLVVRKLGGFFYPPPFCADVIYGIPLTPITTVDHSMKLSAQPGKGLRHSIALRSLARRGPSRQPLYPVRRHGRVHGDRPAGRTGPPRRLVPVHGLQQGGRGHHAGPAGGPQTGVAAAAGPAGAVEHTQRQTGH